MVLRFVFRNLCKRPFLNFIKVLGLALGLGGILFIALFLKNELSYDTYHSKADRIYRFTLTDPSFFGNNHFARIPNSEQIPDLAEYFPEIENYVRLSPIRGGVMMHNENYFSINEAFICDSTFLEIFDTELLLGEKQTILNAPGSMIVSESFARKVFGKASPIGETISIPAGQYNDKNTDFTIKGVMKDFPQNSHFHPELIATPAQGKINWWAWTYLLLKDHSSPDKIIAGYAGFLAKTNNEPIDKIQTKAYLQKITDVHLHSDKLREVETNGNPTNLFVLAIAAIILLLISMGNYTSLNLGMAGFNKKFIAINQILGSTKQMNLNYFAIESLIIVATSVGVALLVAYPVNQFIIQHFNIDLLAKNTTTTTLTILVFSLFGGVSGLTPVLKQHIEKLLPNKKQNELNTNSVVVSKGIIIAQISFAIILIGTVLIIWKQTSFAMKNSMGKNNSNIIIMQDMHANVQTKFEVFKDELLKINSIESVSAMLEPPGGEANDAFPFELEGFKQEDNTQKNLIGVFPCDYSLANVFKLDFLSGNNFSAKNIDVEGAGEYIINEAALRYLGFTNPDDIIGKNFKLNSPSPGIELNRGKIVSVVKDFHLSSMKKKVSPLVMFKRDKMWLINFVVSYKQGMQSQAIADVQKVWTKMFPNYPFNSEHINSIYKKTYKEELFQAKLLSIFTFIALFICSMGLLGISLLTTQQRIKEIGIRKVNGAKISEVLIMLNRDFVKWVAIAFVIATPIAYYAMHKWLENFAYKTELSWWIFALAGLLALGIALLTVSWQSWRAATRNPVEALRYE